MDRIEDLLSALRSQAEALQRELAAGAHPAAASGQGLAAQVARAAEEAGRATAAVAAEVRALHARLVAVDAERQRYRSLFESAPDGYLITELDGTIQEANWAAGILLNIPESSLLGQPLWHFVPAGDQPDFREHLAGLENVAGVREWESRLERRGEGPFDVSVALMPYVDAAGVMRLRWLIHDITARKQAVAQAQRLNAELEGLVAARTAELRAANEHLQAQALERQHSDEAIRASQARLAAIIASAMDAIITVDDRQHIVLFNAAAEHMFRYSAAEVAGQPLDRLIPAHHRRAHRAHVRGFAQTGVTSRQMGHLGKLTALRSDGSEFPIEAAISQTSAFGQKYYTVILRDVTEHVAAEQTLQARARQQAAVAELGQDALSGAEWPALLHQAVRVVAQTLDADCAVAWEADGGGRQLTARAAYNWPEPEPRQRPLPADLTGLEQIRRGPVLVRHGEVKADNPIGLSHRGLDSQVSVPIGRDRQGFGLLAVYARGAEAFRSHDANFLAAAANVLAAAVQRRQAEAQILALNASLEARVAERTAQLEAKNRELETFTYSVSHDLKAPLRTIDGYGRLLAEEHAGRLDEEGAAFVATIRGAADQMVQLIDDLLAYSRLERRLGHSQPLELQAVMEGILAERANELQRRGVQVRVELDCAVVSADAEGLAQALRNLLDNALKFTIGVPVPVITVRSQPTETGCVLSVRDNGIGFDMAFHDRIFGIFQRLHRAEDIPGTGIGLAIVDKAMRRMHGRVWAESQPGQGATFFLEIPKPAEAEWVPEGPLAGSLS